MSNAPVNANWVILGCGWHADDQCCVLHVVGPDDQQWVVPTDEATVNALQAAGLPNI